MAYYLLNIAQYTMHIACYDIYSVKVHLITSTHLPHGVASWNAIDVYLKQQLQQQQKSICILLCLKFPKLFLRERLSFAV